MTFRVGQKVVCVKPTEELIKGGVYTISGIGQFGYKFLVDVAEVKTRVPYAFYPWRFRPIVERKTSIEIFTRMLLPQGVEA